MFKPTMIENEKLLQCCQKHNQPIIQVILNPQLSIEQRFLCVRCLDDIYIEGKSIGFKKIIEIIQEQQKSKMDQLDDIIVTKIKNIEQFEANVIQLKQNLLTKLDQLLFIIKDWINALLSIGQRYSKYSFYEELETLINNKNNGKLISQNLINDIRKEQSSWNLKVQVKLEYFKQFSEYDKCKEILSNSQQDASNQQNMNANIKDFKLSSTPQQEIKVMPIDLFKQQETCFCIAFNSSDSIMVSGNETDIKIWNFNNRRIQLQSTFKKDNCQINCLVYSKKDDAFILGSNNKIMRMWKQVSYNQWTSSSSYQQHAGSIYCMILNQNEDQLFTGGNDNAIKVWSVDFQMNKLIYLYSLEKHNNYVSGLSLNESESILASCANNEDQIVIWEKGQEKRMKFKYYVKQSTKCSGSTLKFIKENQFVLVTNSSNINQLIVFEMKKGVFQEVQEKNIQLNTNNQLTDKYLFPIVYNKLKNVIIVRHKTCIYLIRELNNGNFKIIEQLNINTCNIYGTLTNNGQNLIYWDEKNRGYSLFELQYK